VSAADRDPVPAARAAAVVIKDEPAARVERLGSGADAVVRKTYRNRGLRLLQTFLRRARAEREHGNLALVAARGLPCAEPVGCSAERRFGFVLSSTLVTRYVADAQALKSALAGAPPAQRRVLARALGELLGALHAAGVLWCTPMPRNVLVQGPPARPRLLLCDLPAAIDFGAAVPTRWALLDLFDAFASPSRRREWSRAERLRGLIAWARGDRSAARRAYRTLHRRSAAGHRLRKNLVMALRTYILGGLRMPKNATRTDQVR
jgi:tRNA A-37 threonylcarbamoyl transferase component Bud32